jgi:mutator protein MutT
LLLAVYALAFGVGPQRSGDEDSARVPSAAVAPERPSSFDGVELRARLQRHLDGFERLSVPLEGRRHAAVALAITDGETREASFVLTRRTSKLRDHAGQWALPGGRLDAGETPAEAALRELHEEVGLELAPDAALGTLDDYPTRSGFVITPVVVWAGENVQLRPNPHEVAKAYHVPLSELDRPEVPHLRRIPECERPVIAIPLLDSLIHAPTAGVIFQLREVAVHGRATRVAGYEQPVFAWK